ncbi:MAG: class I SAM-dependent methyltransferase [Phycisphaerales bacterium]|nr:class I SAM-dependent methyltransferase [Phycisphaerales bacterium]
MSRSTLAEQAAATVCRSCAHRGLKPVLDLGVPALADTLVSADRLNHPEKKYPLQVGFCPSCSLVQVLQTIPPDEIFHDDYPYFSSFSETLLEHSRANALSLIEKRKLNKGSLVIELASNDGYLLKNFLEHGIPVLGIDPAPGPAAAAQKIGVPTIRDFFGSALAGKLAAEGRKADVVIANNVMAHVADLNGFISGIATILKDDGALVTESPYVKELVDHCEFDTIYHEHLCYYSITALDNLFRRHGLYLNDVQPLTIHGGSLRSTAEKKPNPSPRLKQMLEQERKLGLDRIDYYVNFAHRVQQLQTDLRKMLSDLKAQGKRIAAYGASAKGSTLLSYIDVGPDVIEFVVDRNIHKQGKFMPGLHHPILPPDAIAQHKPDYLLLLVWNFIDEILRQQKAFRDAGGKFIVPIPSPHIV